MKKRCRSDVSDWVVPIFSSLGKRESKQKSALRRTVNAYLIMIHWLFQDHLSQKMKERNRRPIFYCTNYLGAFSPSSLCCGSFPFLFFSFFFLDWHCDTLVRARPAQTQAKSSTEQWESTRHRFVRSPSGSQTTTDSINCFLRLWQLSGRRRTNARNAKATPVLGAFVGLKSIKVAPLFLTVVQTFFFSFSIPDSLVVNCWAKPRTKAE